MQDMKVTLSGYLPTIDRADERDKELRNACKEFESIFMYQLLQSMRRTVEKNDLFHGGHGEDIYESLLDQELAKEMSVSDSNGLAGMLYQQLRKGDPLIREQEGDLSAGKGLGHGSPVWPLRSRLSSEFGWRKDPIDGEKRFHYGVDLAAREGDEVRASLPGRVLVSAYQQGYGNLVVLDHGRGFTSLYAHNQENLVKPGDWVNAGTPVARAGSSGRSTGPHLHFEMRRHGRPLDPIDLLET